MSTAQSLDLVMNNIMESPSCLPATGKVEDYLLACPPRLEMADLDDPVLFHNRLVAWLMQQK